MFTVEYTLPVQYHELETGQLFYPLGRPETVYMWTDEQFSVVIWTSNPDHEVGYADPSVCDDDSDPVVIVERKGDKYAPQQDEDLPTVGASELRLEQAFLFNGQVFVVTERRNDVVIMAPVRAADLEYALNHDDQVTPVDLIARVPQGGE